MLDCIRAVRRGFSRPGRAAPHNAVARRGERLTRGTAWGGQGVSRRNFWLLALALLMGGCARLPVEPEAADFRIEGKVGVVEGARAFSARFSWRQTGTYYDIRLWGPLGQAATRLRGDSNHVEVVGKNGTPILAGDPQSVMRQRLGWSLPLPVLRWWMSGRPVPEGIVEGAETDEQGRLTGFRQLGWQVRYDRFEASGEPPMPTRISAERPGYRIRLTILTR